MGVWVGAPRAFAPNGRLRASNNAGNAVRESDAVVAVDGSSYDLFLTRELRHAKMVRTFTSQAVFDTMLSAGHRVSAGVRQQLETDAARLGRLRMLPGSSMVIRQAMGCPQSNGDAAAAAAYLCGFVERMKATGFVNQALLRHGIQGTSVGPAGG